MADRIPAGIGICVDSRRKPNRITFNVPPGPGVIVSLIVVVY
jgi:hypothetical protein